MLKSSLKSVWARKVRLLMSTFAIVLGVAFVAGSLMFTDTLNKAFTGMMNGTVPDVRVQISGAQEGHRTAGGTSTAISPAILDKVRKLPGVQQAEGDITTMSAYVLGKNGNVVGGQGAPALGFNYQTAPAAGNVQGLRVTSGRAPTKAGEVALDRETLTRGGYRLGDTVTVLTSGNPPRYQAKLVGTIGYAGGASVGATMVIVDTHTAQQLFLDGKNGYQSLWVAAKPGTTQSTLASQIKPLLPKGYEIVTGDKASEESANAIKQALSFITTFLLVFAGIALLVGSFLIVNTFGMLIAQRTRELALMRALGASARQVQGSVLVEALIVGLLGSLLGIGLGVALAHGIVALFGAVGAELNVGTMILSPRTVLISLAVGLIVTALAAWLPARRAARIAPVAAMRDDHVEPEQQVKRRSLIGVVLLLIGAAAMIFQLQSKGSVWWLALGMFLGLFGAIAATPLVARPIVRLVTAPGRGGVVPRLAGDNALRNPRRTASTASALMVGLTLVTMMTVFGASASGSIDKQISEQFKGDFVVAGLPGQALSPTIASSMKKVDGVETLSAVRMTPGKANGTRTTIFGVNPRDYEKVTELTMASGTKNLTDDGVLVAQKSADFFKLKPGDKVTLTVDGVTVKQVPVQGVIADPKDGFTEFSDGFTVTTKLFGELGGAARDARLTILTRSGADKEQVRRGLDQVITGMPTISVKDQAGYAAEQRQPIDQMLMLIYGLLGLAIIIAALGVLNTLALSILERTREVGLLRALGLSRRQLRRMVRIESIAITLIGAVTGVVLGTLYGIAFRASQADSGVTTLVMPYGRLVLFLVLAIVIGVVAAWWPARRAAKMNVLDAIATE